MRHSDGAAHESGDHQRLDQDRLLVVGETPRQLADVERAGSDPGDALRAEIRMSENCRYRSHYGGTDQLIRWARFTMNPSGPRTAAIRQVSSY
jgi:hypothetical protein